MAESSISHNDLMDDTKVSDTLLSHCDHDEEEDIVSKPSRTHRDRQTILMSALLSILCVLLVVDITLRLVTLSDWGSNESRLHRQPFGSNESRLHRQPFGSNESYMSLDHKFDHLWDSEFAANNAIVYIPPADGKQTGDSDEDIEPGAITMFHQLHCLTSIRKIMQYARDGGQIGLDNHDDHHWPHCLYYLRQAILCNADDTIERAPPLVNGTRGMINGAYDMRICRDNRQLYELRERYGTWGKNETSLRESSPLTI